MRLLYRLKIGNLLVVANHDIFQLFLDCYGAKVAKPCTFECSDRPNISGVGTRNTGTGLILTKRIEFIGIPDNTVDDRQWRPSWEVWLADYFDGDAQPVVYTYDFGDNWRHLVHLEDFDVVDPKKSYPRCIGGARRCPPEDCGGVYGYRQFLEAIADPTHSEHESYLEWVGGSFDPDDFDPNEVVFADPYDRWRQAFLRH
jgi:hypothetical protein